MLFFASLLLLWSASIILIVAGLSRHRTFVLSQRRMRDISVAGLPGSIRTFRESLTSAYAGVAPALARLGSLTTSEATLGNLERQLLDAGSPMNMQAIELFGLKVFLAFLFALIGVAIFFFLSGLDLAFRCLPLVAFPVVGFALPTVVLRAMAKNRRQEMRYALPDMLDLLIINVEAGMGLEAAIHRAVERLRMPLSYELERVLAEIKTGKSRVQALKEMAERLRIEDLSLIIAAIHQSEQLGASMAPALRQQARQMRRRRANELREIAAKLPTKLLFPIVLFIFPTLFMVLLGPGIIMIMRSGAF